MPHGTLAYPTNVSTTLAGVDRDKEMAYKTALISPNADATF